MIRVGNCRRSMATRRREHRSPVSGMRLGRITHQNVPNPNFVSRFLPSRSDFGRALLPSRVIIHILRTVVHGFLFVLLLLAAVPDETPDETVPPRRFKHRPCPGRQHKGNQKIPGLDGRRYLDHVHEDACSVSNSSEDSRCGVFLRRGIRRLELPHSLVHSCTYDPRISILLVALRHERGQYIVRQASKGCWSVHRCARWVPRKQGAKMTIKISGRAGASCSEHTRCGVGIPSVKRARLTD